MDQALSESSEAAFRRTHRRIAAVAAVDPAVTRCIEQLTGIAECGLVAAYDPVAGTFAQTVRGLAGGDGVRVVREGQSLRYAAMAALGISRLPLARQQAILAGRSAVDLALSIATRVAISTDPGEVALAAWAAAEVAEAHAGRLLERLVAVLEAEDPVATVTVAWALTAAVKAAPYGDTERLLEVASRRLRSSIGSGGTYPHLVPRAAVSQRWRAHVGSFADQIYPVQALALAAKLTGELWMLKDADLTAHRLCELQGDAGQWWWHYDARDGSVVEEFPVYSVHQHAMAPMVLLDLLEAGGSDHRNEIARGVGWLTSHPEVVEELVSDRFSLIWRKVARREPRKAARALGAATTALRPGLRMPGIGALLPPTRVDHECRPYELGWLLYGWLDPGGDDGG